MSTKMDDKIESLYEKEIEAKISYEGYARLDEALYTEFTAKSFLKALKRDSIKVVKMGVNQCHLDKIKKEYKDEGTGFCKCHNRGSENNTLSQINGKGKELHDKKAGLHLRLKKV